MKLAPLLRLARPHFLLAGLALYVWGGLWGVVLGAPLFLTRLVLGYMVILPGHLSLSYSNDYFDVEVDRHGTPTLLSGGSGVLVRRPDLMPWAKGIAGLLTLVSVVLGIAVWALYQLPVGFLALVAVGNLLTWAYSAPPWRLSFRGLGEISTALTAGVLLPTMGTLVMQARLEPASLLYMPPLMAVGLAFIVLVEIPDVEADRLGGKTTLVVRRGRISGFRIAWALLLAVSAYWFLLAQIQSRIDGLDFSVLAWFSLLPLAAGSVGAIRRPSDREAATWIAQLIVLSLAGFFAFADGYLIYLVSR